MLYHRGELFGTRILSEESIATMTSNKVGDLYSGKGDQKGVGFGYTVMIVLDENAGFGHRGVGAFGWGGAFGTVSWTDPAQEITAVLMVQQASKAWVKRSRRLFSRPSLSEAPCHIHFASAK